MATESRRSCTTRSTKTVVAPHGLAVVGVRFKGPAVRRRFDIESSADVLSCELITAAGTQTFTRRPSQAWPEVFGDVEAGDGDHLRVVVANDSDRERPMEVRITFTKVRRARARGFFAGRRRRSRASNEWYESGSSKRSKRKRRVRRVLKRTPRTRVRLGAHLRTTLVARGRRQPPVTRRAGCTRANAAPPRLGALVRARRRHRLRFSSFSRFVATRSRSRRGRGSPPARGPPPARDHRWRSTADGGRT